MDPVQRRKALRMLHHTVVFIAARHEEEVAGATITWLTQASFEPPLIAVSVRADSTLYGIIGKSKSFAVSVLGEDQMDVARQFFKGIEIEGQCINGQPFEQGARSGAPILLNAPAWFECEVRRSVEGGDHTVVIAEVVDAGARTEDKALLLANTPWKYGG